VGIRSLFPRIVLLENSVEITEHLTHIIDNDPDLTLVAHYSSAEEALLTNMSDLKIHVFLVNLGLPGINGIDFIVRAKMVFPSSQFLVHTVSESSKNLMTALAAGAVGYILKGSSAEEICSSLKIVAKGGSILSPRMATKLVQFFSEVKPPKKILTPTELNILKKLRTGLTYAQIAEENVVSSHTIHTHVKNIYRHLNVGSREEAVKSALFYGVLNKIISKIQ